jgi:hypothetical protein
MSELVLKSVNHLYRLFKVYSTLAILGALAVILAEIFIAKPVILFTGFVVVTFTLTVILIWVQSSGRRRRKFIRKRLQELQDERPPKLPESLMVMTLPAEIAEHIMGDLSEQFYHLRYKYGRYSAVGWYTIQSMSISVRATALHLGLNVGKSLTQFLKKESS